MSSARIVETIDEVTATWLTAALAGADVVASVRDVKAAPIGTGQMGSCFRLSLDYADGSGPERLVVKLPATDPATRSAGTLGYRCETSFYREVADRVSIRTPQCYFAEVNDSGDTFTLLLEDLAPKEQGDQIAGCTVAEAEAAAVNVAGLHAPMWNDPSIRALDWLIPDLTAMPDFTAELVRDGTRQFLDRVDLQPETTAVLRRFADDFVAWASDRPGPFSLLHSDYRLDNLLFAPSGSPDPVVAVDWQVVTVGHPLRDVAFLVATGLRTEDRRPSERRIVESYHRRLVDLGVQGYGVDRCWDDYRFALFQAPFIIVLGSLVAQATERGDLMFTTMAERSAAAIIDHNALSLL
jgi:Ecdysteroid kinase-like family